LNSSALKSLPGATNTAVTAFPAASLGNHHQAFFIKRISVLQSQIAALECCLVLIIPACLYLDSYKPVCCKCIVLIREKFLACASVSAGSRT